MLSAVLIAASVAGEFDTIVAPPNAEVVYHANRGASRIL